MISMRDAFGSATTTEVILYRYIEGRWNDDNQWEKAGYEDPTPIAATPIPVGERQTGTHGENLTPDKTGERTPASMKFTSLTELQLKDVISYAGINYKMSRKGDYSAAGYWTNVGITLPQFDPTRPPEDNNNGG